MQSLDSLHLNDHRVVDQQVDTIACIQSNSGVEDRKLLLTLNIKSMHYKFVHQTNLIGPFEHTWTECLVNLDRKLDYLASNLIQLCGSHRLTSLNFYTLKPLLVFLRGLRGLCVKKIISKSAGSGVLPY